VQEPVSTQTSLSVLKPETSVCPYERWDLGNTGAELLGLAMQILELKYVKIPEIPAQRKFVSLQCHAHKPPKTVVSATPTLTPTNRPNGHAHFNAHKPPKPATPT